MEPVEEDIAGRIGTPEGPDPTLPVPLVRRFLIAARGSALRKAVFRTATMNVAISLLGGLGGLLLARGLGATQRGELVIVTTWPTFVGLLAAWGLPQATCFLVAKNSHAGGEIVTTGVLACGSAAIVVGIAGVLAAPLITDSPGAVMGLRLVFLLLPVYMVPGVWMAALQAIDNKRWNRARAVQPLSYFPAILGLYLTHRLTLWTGTVVFISSILLQAFVTAFFAARHSLIRRPDATYLRPLLSYGSRSVAADAPWLINSRLDQVVLSLIVPAAALGNYAVAVSLSLLASPLAMAFGYVAFPRIAEEKDPVRARRMHRMAVWGSLVASTIVLIPLGIVSPWLIPLLFGASFKHAVIPFLILVPATVIFVTNKVTSDLLRGYGRPGIPAVAEWISAIFTIALLFVLVPWLGISGASLTSLIAYGASGVLLAVGLARASRSALETTSVVTGRVG